MSQVLILGAGLVAGPLVSYLNKEQISITLASHITEEAQKMAQGKSLVTPIKLDVGNREELRTAVTRHKIVVSFLPYKLHPVVARVCLKEKVHLVTASYRSVEMEQFHQQAKEQGVLILNEMGFDPGLDHLSAMNVIDSIKDNGGTVESFVSWGSGLPSPDCNDNPFGYKFAWAPMSVLMAMLNDARFLRNGKIIDVAADHLLDNTITAWTGEKERFEGYPNRDSMPYQSAYGLDDVKNLMRGTLRYEGNLEIMRFAKNIGLFSHQNLETKGKWSDLLAELLAVPSDQLSKNGLIPEHVFEAFKWAGMIGNDTVSGQSAIEAYCNQLQKHLQFKANETDMALLIHKFAYRDVNGSLKYKMSKFKLYGDPGGDSAMAKAVGTPAGIATKLILDGKVSKTGSILPVNKDFHSKMLPLLKMEGLICSEYDIDDQRGEFLSEVEG